MQCGHPNHKNNSIQKVLCNRAAVQLGNHVSASQKYTFLAPSYLTNFCAPFLRGNSFFFPCGDPLQPFAFPLGNGGELRFREREGFRKEWGRWGGTTDLGIGQLESVLKGASEGALRNRGAQGSALEGTLQSTLRDVPVELCCSRSADSQPQITVRLKTDSLKHVCARPRTPCRSSSV